VNKFKNAGPGAILVGPSFGTGFDFPGPQCEYQIMVKIPFEPPSKILKARESADKEYRGHRATTAMDQAFGRGNRFKGDRCQSLIFDMNMEWFWPKNQHLASANFRSRLKMYQILPQPLEKM
jgi:Rad3-related DNA helicase